MSNNRDLCLPDFLIIGAMKAGTTSIYRELSNHPEVFLPEDKEPETLIKFNGDLSAIYRDYKDLFRYAKQGQVLGEGSTAYTKMPTFMGTAKIAKAVCGPNLKLIYIQRNPIDRIISQYKHEAGENKVKGDINDVIFADNRYIRYSDYEYQLSAWQEYFDNRNILTVHFEDYINNRNSVLRDICAHIGVDTDKKIFSKPVKTQNASDFKPIATTWLSKTIINNKLYQRHIKRLLSHSLRKKIALLILPNTGKISHLAKLNSDSIMKLNEHFKKKNEH